MTTRLPVHDIRIECPELVRTVENLAEQSHDQQAFLTAVRQHLQELAAKGLEVQVKCSIAGRPVCLSARDRPESVLDLFHNVLRLAVQHQGEEDFDEPAFRASLEALLVDRGHVPRDGIAEEILAHHLRQHPDRKAARIFLYESLKLFAGHFRAQTLSQRLLEMALGRRVGE